VAINLSFLTSAILILSSVCRPLLLEIIFIVFQVIEQKFSVDLRFGNTNRRRNAAKHLHWINYETSVVYRDGSNSSSTIDVNDQRYPPMHYSRVRSYAVGDDGPLI